MLIFHTIISSKTTLYFHFNNKQNTCLLLTHFPIPELLRYISRYLNTQTITVQGYNSQHYMVHVFLIPYNIDPHTVQYHLPQSNLPIAPLLESMYQSVMCWLDGACNLWE